MTIDWLGLTRDAFSESCSYFDANVRQRLESDLRQFQAQHPVDSKYHSESYKWRSRLFSPKTRAVIRKNEAIAAEAFFSSMDALSITPEDVKSDIQKVSADGMQHLMQYRLTKTIPWFLTLIGAYQEAQTCGVVWSRQYWEYRRRGAQIIDRPCIELIPVENMRVSPASKWYDVVGTTPYLIELVPMFVKDVKARMTAPDGSEPKWKPMEEAELKKAVTPFGDSIRMARDANQRVDPKETGQAITEFTIVWVYRVVMEWNGQDYVWYTLATQDMLSDPIPLENVYHHGMRPYAMGMCVLEAHRIYTSSVPSLTRDIQREINEIKNQRRDNVLFVLNKRYFVKRNRNVDLASLRQNIPGSSTLMDDPGTDVIPQNFPDVTNSAYAEEDRANLDFDDVAGAFSGASVQSNRRLNETVGGMNILTTNANQVSGYQLRTFVETWAEPVLRQVMLLEQYYESDDRILALVGSRSQAIQKFGMDALTDDMLAQELTLSVNVGMGATNPHQQVDLFLSAMKAIREILADGLLERYGLKVDELIKEILGKVGHKNGGRFFDFETDDPRIMAMQAQLEQMQKALEAKIPPELLAAQVEKAMAEVKRITAQTVNENVRAIYAAMQSGQVIAAVPAIAPIADSALASAGFEDQNGGTTVMAPAQTPPGISTKPLFDPRTGVQIEQNTSPASPPVPASPEAGAGRGIETMRADGA